jgi:hypothetical protein
MLHRVPRSSHHTERIGGLKSSKLEPARTAGGLRTNTREIKFSIFGFDIRFAFATTDCLLVAGIKEF